MRFSAVEATEQYLSAPLSQRVLPFARRLDTILRGSDDAAIAQRMSLIAFVIRVASAGLAFLSQVIIARWTGTFEYGIYVLVWTATIILGDLSCLGFHTVVIRYLPQYKRDGDLDRLRGLLRTSRIFTLVLSSAVAAVSVGAVWLLSDRIESYYVLPFVLVFTCLPMVAVGDVLEGIARANAWPVRALAPSYIMRPVLILVFMAAIHGLGFEATAVSAVIAAVLATYVTTIVQLVSVTRDLDAIYPSGSERNEFGTWMVFALPVFFVEGFFFLLTNADVLMIGMFLPPDDVAVYFATVKTLALVHFVFFAVKAGVAQSFAGRTNPEDRQSLRAFARRTVDWTFWPSLAMAAAVLLFGHMLLSMFGAEFAEGYPLLFTLVVGVVLRAAVGPAESLLNMTGYQNVCAMIFAAVLTINIVANLILIPIHGLMGAAIASTGATAIEALLLLFVVWRRVGVVMLVFTPHPREAVS